MKRIMYGGVLGCVFAGLLFACTQIPTEGPSPLALVVIPFQILASLITKDRAAGECAFYFLQLLFFGGFSYLVLGRFAAFRHEEETRQQ
jgi:hypothetical protein